MEAFEPYRRLHEIKHDFKRSEEFYHSFRHQFIISLFLVVKRHDKNLQLDETMNGNLQLYADEMLSCVESVLYKDFTYPDGRLEEELKTMNRIVSVKPELEQHMEFINKLHLKAKEMIVRHYPPVFELSATGFRLLERYSRMYNLEFVSNFYSASGSTESSIVIQ
ncbi:MAG: hypothetical protein JXR22_05950 [Prolixibacteraceae bacterium]|nr:hypothetical protein [Prolixibacteraceae bacterium]